MISAGDLATPKVEGKVALAMTSGFLGLGDFPKSFSDLKCLTGVSDPALAKALKKLLRLRVIERTPYRKYKLRPGQRERLLTYLRPFYSEYFTEKTRLVAKELAKFDEVLAIVLFGSTAQGKAAHDSDVDLLIVLERRDDVLEKRIDRSVSRMCEELKLPFEHVYISLGGLKTIMEREYSFLFGLVEGYECLLDRAGVGPLLRVKEKDIRERYRYLPEVPMWLLKK